VLFAPVLFAGLLQKQTDLKRSVVCTLIAMAGSEGGSQGLKSKIYCFNAQAGLHAYGWGVFSSSS
jgi:hypothetical protein